MAHFRLFHSWQNEFVHLENTSMRKQRERFVFSFLREEGNPWKLETPSFSFLSSSFFARICACVCVCIHPIPGAPIIKIFSWISYCSADNGRFSAVAGLLFTVFPSKLPWNTFRYSNRVCSGLLFKSIPRHYFRTSTPERIRMCFI